MDDPIIWGSLPYAYHFNADNLRWSLASHDIVFKNRYAFTKTSTVTSISIRVLIGKQVCSHVLLSRQHFTDPPSRLLAARRPLPTNNNPSNPPPKPRTIHQSPNNSTTISAHHSIPGTQHLRPLQLFSPDLQHRRLGPDPSSKRLRHPPPRMDPRLPRGENPPAPAQSDAVLQMGRCALNPRSGADGS